MINTQDTSCIPLAINNDPKLTESNLFWNGMHVEKFMMNKKLYENVYINGIKVITPAPIPPGTYVHYRYDKDLNDFYVDNNGFNKVKDLGTGNYPGTLFSAREVYITSNGELRIPVNPGGALVYFDYSLRQHKQIEITTETEYILSNVRIGHIVILHSIRFPTQDLEFLDNDPGVLIEWARGEDNPLNVQRGPNDSYYPNTEYSGNIIREMTDISNTLTIEGEFLRLKRSPAGLQVSRTVLSIDEIPTERIKGKYVFMNGNEVMHTGVAIDGLTTDFTMMMSFTLPLRDPGHNQFIAFGNGENKIFLMHKTGDPINRLNVGIGRQMVTIDLDPSVPFHAMVMIWDYINQTIKFAKDGEPLSQDFPLIFDGKTEPVFLGAMNYLGEQGFYGFIGQGVLAATKVTESEWLDFWNSVKDERPFIIPENVLCDEYYRCNELWDCDSSII